MPPSAALLSDDPSATRPLYRPLRAQALAGGSAPCGPFGVRASRSGNPTPLARANLAVLREHPCGPLRGSPTANVPYETLARFFGSSRYEPSLRSPIRVHEAREVIAAYADGADFDYTVSRLAPIGEKMSVLLA